MTLRPGFCFFMCLFFIFYARIEGLSDFLGASRKAPSSWVDHALGPCEITIVTRCLRNLSNQAKKTH